MMNISSVSALKSLHTVKNKSSLSVGKPSQDEKFLSICRKTSLSSQGSPEMWKSGSPDELPDKITSLKVQYVIMNFKILQVTKGKTVIFRKILSYWTF
jgi:hypothetical protein